MSVVESLRFDQQEIIADIARLHCEGGAFECDITYGNGGFWKNGGRPPFRFDIDPQSEDVTQADSRTLPLPAAAVSSIMFDPPFLTYVRQGREGNGDMVMSKRFAGYWRYDELAEHYQSTFVEARRVLRKDGILVLKCQDIIHNHRIHATHVNAINWAGDRGFRLLDLYVLAAKHRMPSPNRAGVQKHARIHHSYFLVFKAV